TRVGGPLGLVPRVRAPSDAFALVPQLPALVYGRARNRAANDEDRQRDDRDRRRTDELCDRHSLWHEHADRGSPGARRRYARRQFLYRLLAIVPLLAARQPRAARANGRLPQTLRRGRRSDRSLRSQ